MTIPTDPSTQPGQPEPAVEYFPPAGGVLPTRTFQRNSRIWWWLVSILAGLLLATLAVLAIAVGLVSASRFTAVGAVQIDCKTGAALTGAPIKSGDKVKIFHSEDGELAGASRLDDELEAKGGNGACFARFKIGDIEDGRGAYLVEVGDAPGVLYTRAALEAGVLMHS